MEPNPETWDCVYTLGGTLDQDSRMRCWSNLTRQNGPNSTSYVRDAPSRFPAYASGDFCALRKDCLTRRREGLIFTVFSLRDLRGFA
jgi:hypothetical protein